MLTSDQLEFVARVLPYLMGKTEQRFYLEAVEGKGFDIVASSPEELAQAIILHTRCGDRPGASLANFAWGGRTYRGEKWSLREVA